MQLQQLQEQLRAQLQVRRKVQVGEHMKMQVEEHLQAQIEVQPEAQLPQLEVKLLVQSLPHFVAQEAVSPG